MSLMFTIMLTCYLATAFIDAKPLVPSSKVWPSLEQQTGIGYRYGNVQPLWMTHVGMSKFRGGGALKSKDIPSVYWRFGDGSISNPPTLPVFKDSIPPFFNYLSRTKSSMDNDDQRIPLYLDYESDIGEIEESGKNVLSDSINSEHQDQHQNQQKEDSEARKIDILRRIIEERESSAGNGISKVTGEGLNMADKRSSHSYSPGMQRLRLLLQSYLKSLSKLNKNKNQPKEAPALTNNITEQDGIWGR